MFFIRFLQKHSVKPIDQTTCEIFIETTMWSIITQKKTIHGLWNFLSEGSSCEMLIKITSPDWTSMKRACPVTTCSVMLLNIPKNVIVSQELFKLYSYAIGIFWMMTSFQTAIFLRKVQIFHHNFRSSHFAATMYAKLHDCTVLMKL